MDKTPLRSLRFSSPYRSPIFLEFQTQKSPANAGLITTMQGRYPYNAGAIVRVSLNQRVDFIRKTSSKSNQIQLSSRRYRCAMCLQ